MVIASAKCSWGYKLAFLGCWPGWAEPANKAAGLASAELHRCNYPRFFLVLSIKRYLRFLLSPWMPHSATSTGVLLMRELLKSAEVAELLGVHVLTLRALSKSGRFPKPLTIGRTYRWRRKDVELFIASGSVVPMTPEVVAAR